MKLKESLTKSMPYYKRMLTIAFPIMIQNGITNFVSMLDNIMVGRVGTLQMTGVSIVNQLIFVFNLCIFGATSGAGIFTAQFHGCGDHNGVRSTFRFKILIGLLLSAVGVSVFLLFGQPLIRLYLQGEGTAEVLFKAGLTREQEYALMESGALIDLAPLIDAHMPNLSALFAAHPAWKEIVCYA